MKNGNEKEWVRVIGYLIPVIALVVANLLHIEDPTELENALMVLFTAVMGVLGAVGVIATHDKDAGKGNSDIYRKKR